MNGKDGLSKGSGETSTMIARSYLDGGDGFLTGQNGLESGHRSKIA